MIGAWVVLASDSEGVDPTKASSGFVGFLVIFLMALAIWLLGRNLTGRLRRMNRRFEQEQAGDGGDSTALAGGTADVPDGQHAPGTTASGASAGDDAPATERAEAATPHTPPPADPGARRN